MSHDQIRDCMSPDYVSVSEYASIAAGQAKMLEHFAPELFIVNESDELLGVVPDYDLLKCVWLGVKLDDSLRSIASPVSVAFSSTESLETVVHVLSHHIHRRVPVVESGKLIGIIDRVRVLGLISGQAAVDHSQVCKSFDIQKITVPEPKYAAVRLQAGSASAEKRHNR